MDSVQSIDYIDGITLEMLVDGSDTSLLDEASTVLYEEPLHYTEDVGADVSSEDEEEEVFALGENEAEVEGCWEPADEDENAIGGKNGKVPLDLPPDLKKYLELDHFQVVCCEKLVILPANPCVNTILETYYREYASDILQYEEDAEEQARELGVGRGGASKSLRLRRQRQRRLSSESSGDCLLDEDKEFEEILRNLRICLEVLHSVRYYVDFTLGDHLLYPAEKSQHQVVVSAGKGNMYVKQEPASSEEGIEEYNFLDKISMLDSEDKSETEDDLLEILSSNDQSFAKRWNDFLGNDEADPKSANNISEHPDSRREPSENEGDSLAEVPAYVRRRREMLARIQDWKLVPDVEVDEDGEDSTPNSQIYGAIHLSRLMVKLPEFLYLTKFPSQGHLRAVQRHLNLFINYLAGKDTWFSENQYRPSIYAS